MTFVVPEAIANEARRRNDEGVRRLREESGRRIARQRSIGMSRCMLGAMVSMLLFVTLEARREYWVATAINAQARVDMACATFERRQTEIDVAKSEQLASAFDAEQIRRIEGRSRAALETARRLGLEQGCAIPALAPLPPPPRPSVFPVSAIWYAD